MENNFCHVYIDANKEIQEIHTAYMIVSWPINAVMQHTTQLLS